MIKSMTAYGRAGVAVGDIRYISEIRSVNNRYRDIVLRLPKPVQPLEEELRSLVLSRVGRGRVEVSLQMEKGGDAPAVALELNAPLAEAYMKIVGQLTDRPDIDPKLRVDTLLQLKDVVCVKPETVDLDEARQGFEESLTSSLNSLDEMKDREGAAIKDDFIKRLNRLSDYTERIYTRAPLVVDTYRKRLQDNVRHMLNGVSLDESRLAQEVAIYAERADITEEIVRIKSHIKQFETYLDVGDPVGRRLDFLIQEINREVNTLSAKGSDAQISSTAVEMKGELEKLREQVRNVE